MFDIELIGRPEGQGEGLFNWGRITLGHFRDEFQAPLYEWAPGTMPRIGWNQPSDWSAVRLWPCS